MLRTLSCVVLILATLMMVAPSNAEAGWKEVAKWVAGIYIGGKVSGVIDAVENAVWNGYSQVEEAITDWYISPYTDANEGYCSDCRTTYYESHSCIYMDSYYSESYGGSPTYYRGSSAVSQVISRI